MVVLSILCVLWQLGLYVIHLYKLTHYYLSQIHNPCLNGGYQWLSHSLWTIHVFDLVLLQHLRFCFLNYGGNWVCACCQIWAWIENQMHGITWKSYCWLMISINSSISFWHKLYRFLATLACLFLFVILSFVLIWGYFTPWPWIVTFHSFICVKHCLMSLFSSAISFILSVISFQRCGFSV